MRIAAAFATALIAASPALAAEDEIATVETSGMIFKDKITVTAFDDPTIEGIACYVTTPGRALSFVDPTDSSIACRKVGAIKGDLVSKEGVFSASKSVFFKSFRVDRFWDAKRRVLVYLAYTTKSSGDNAAHSISVVPVTD